MELSPRQKHLLTVLVDYKGYLIVPVFAGMFLALVYVFVLRTNSWTTRQRLLVRDDLLGQSFKPGQFSSFDTMKSRQETILDIARNPNVIRTTLKELGPAKKSWLFSTKDYPDDSTIEQLQGQINLSAPNGAEFGTTEVVVLSVKAPTAQRSADLIKKLLDEIEKQIEQVRISQLKSMEAELTAARDNAKESQQASIKQLREMESMLGPDSIAMATITSAMPGDNSIKAEMLQIQAEKRGFEAQLESLKAAQKTLEQSQDNPLLIVADTGSFFREQAKLAELAKSLVASQMAYAIAAGKYQEAHPSVKYAAEQLAMMENQVASELTNLNNSLDSRIRELEHQVARLDQQLEDHYQRLHLLSEKRGEHLAINSEIAKRTEMLNQYEATLRNVQSYKAGSGNSVWATRIGEPQVAAQPDGLSKRATVLAGGFLGFLFGAGLIVLLAPPFSPISGEEVTANQPTSTSENNNAQARTRTNSASNYVRQSVTNPVASSAANTPVPTPSRVFTGPPASRQLSIQIPNLSTSESQPVSVSKPVERKPAQTLATGKTADQKGPAETASPTPSIQIPDVAEDQALEHIEKFIEKKQANQRPPLEIANLEFAVHATDRAPNTLLIDSTKPEQLLASLRAQRARETDPLANKTVSSNETASVGDQTIAQISQLQQAIGILEPSERQQQAKPISGSSQSTKRAKILTSIPDQVRSISDSILGLVQNKPDQGN
jgi:uncharacterized protein involved in exopolysaccharide biosynthesis